MSIRLIAIAIAVIMGLCGVIYMQHLRNRNITLQLTQKSAQVTALESQRKIDQQNVDTAMLRIKEAQNERNSMARQLAAIKDQQSLDWLHANIPDGVRDILMPTKPTTGHQAAVQ